MRRNILGITLLILLPLLCFPISRELKSYHENLGHQLSQASQLFVRGDDSAGNDLLQRAFQQWEQKRHFTAAFIHHAPLDAIDCDFAAIKAAPNAGRAERCAQLAAQIYALADSNQLGWWDIL